jgi:hypothetical protein
MLSIAPELSISEVIESLLTHIGTMSIHQLNQSNIPDVMELLSSSQLDSLVEVAFLEQLCDILERGIAVKNQRLIIVSLLVLQVCWLLQLVKKTIMSDSNG